MDLFQQLRGSNSSFWQCILPLCFHALNLFSSLFSLSCPFLHSLTLLPSRTCFFPVPHISPEDFSVTLPVLIPDFLHGIAKTRISILLTTLSKSVRIQIYHFKAICWNTVKLKRKLTGRPMIWGRRDFLPICRGARPPYLSRPISWNFSMGCPCNRMAKTEMQVEDSDVTCKTILGTSTTQSTTKEIR